MKVFDCGSYLIAANSPEEALSFAAKNRLPCRSAREFTALDLKLEIAALFDTERFSGEMSVQEAVDRLLTQGSDFPDWIAQLHTC